MNTTVLATGVIATTPFAPEPQWGILLGIGAVLLIPALTNQVPTTATRITVAGGMALALVGGGALFAEYVQAGKKVDEPSVAQHITKKYRISSPAPLDGLLGDLFAKTDPDELCEPVSTDSPEYSGVASGAEIRFRVGIPDCRAPDPEIIITKTTGRTIDLDELRRSE